MRTTSIVAVTTRAGCAVSRAVVLVIVVTIITATCESTRAATVSVASTGIATVGTSALNGSYRVAAIHPIVAITEVLTIAIVGSFVITPVQHTRATALADIAGRARYGGSIAIPIGSGITLETTST